MLIGAQLVPLPCALGRPQSWLPAVPSEGLPASLPSLHVPSLPRRPAWWSPCNLAASPSWPGSSTLTLKMLLPVGLGAAKRTEGSAALQAGGLAVHLPWVLVVGVFTLLRTSAHSRRGSVPHWWERCPPPHLDSLGIHTVWDVGETGRDDQKEPKARLWAVLVEDRGRRAFSIPARSRSASPGSENSSHRRGVHTAMT